MTSTLFIIIIILQILVLAVILKSPPKLLHTRLTVKDQRLENHRWWVEFAYKNHIKYNGQVVTLFMVDEYGFITGVDIQPIFED